MLEQVLEMRLRCLARWWLLEGKEQGKETGERGQKIMGEGLLAGAGRRRPRYAKAAARLVVAFMGTGLEPPHVLP